MKYLVTAIIAAAVAYVTVYLLTEPQYPMCILCDGGEETVTPTWRYN